MVSPASQGLEAGHAAVKPPPLHSCGKHLEGAQQAF